MRNKVNYCLLDDVENGTYIGCVVEVKNELYEVPHDYTTLFDAFDYAIEEHETCTGVRATRDDCELIVIDTTKELEECFL